MRKKFSRKYKSENYEIAAYWKKNKKVLLDKLIKNNPDLRQTSESALYKIFKSDVKAYMEYRDLSVKQAIKANLRTRAFKTQEEFYQESILRNLKENQDEYKILKNFMRKNGRFAKITNPKYKGKVEINGEMYTKYEFVNPAGLTLFAYEASSPKNPTYNIFTSEISYE